MAAFKMIKYWKDFWVASSPFPVALKVGLFNHFQILADFSLELVHFQKKMFQNLFLPILTFHEPFLGLVSSHKKIGPDRFSRYDAYRLETNKQADTQAKYILKIRRVNLYNCSGCMIRSILSVTIRNHMLKWSKYYCL